MRTNRTLLQFAGSFELAGFTVPLPAGIYEISAMDEETDTMLTQGWRRVSTMLRTPSVDRQTGMEQWIEVHPSDIDRALARDAELNSTVTSFSGGRPATLEEALSKASKREEHGIQASQARLQSDSEQKS